LQANSYALMEDMEVVGAIIYKGTDPAGRQLSTVFCGSDVVRKLINDNEMDVRSFLDKLTTSVKCVLIRISYRHANYGHRSVELVREGYKLPLLASGDLDCRPGESTRDRDRRVFTAKMQEKLGQLFHKLSPAAVNLLLDRFDAAASRKMKWKNWLVTGWRHQIRIVNWPIEVPSPGPNFELKKLTSQYLKMLVSGFTAKAKDENVALDIVRWTEGNFRCVLYFVGSN
jgi:hypothetical protein